MWQEPLKRVGSTIQARTQMAQTNLHITWGPRNGSEIWGIRLIFVASAGVCFFISYLTNSINSWHVQITGGDYFLTFFTLLFYISFHELFIFLLNSLNIIYLDVIDIWSYLSTTICLLHLQFYNIKSSLYNFQNIFIN